MNNSFSSEPFLIARLREHDEKAISYLYEHYRNVFSNIIYRVMDAYRFWSTSDKELTKDIIQDIVIRVCYGIQKFDVSDGKFSAWVCIVAKNTVIDFCRNKKNDFNYKNLTRSKLIDSTIGSLRMLDTFEVVNKMDIQIAMQQIKPEQHQAFYLVHIQGYSPNEAARILQIPLGTLKTRIRSGLNVMKNYLQKDANIVTYLLKSEYGSET